MANDRRCTTGSYSKKSNNIQQLLVNIQQVRTHFFLRPVSWLSAWSGPSRVLETDNKHQCFRFDSSPRNIQIQHRHQFVITNST